MNRDDIIRMAQEKRAEAQKVYESIRNGTIDFDDFLNGYLDNLRNIYFDQGYVAGEEDEREECIKLCKWLADRYPESDASSCVDIISLRGKE